jgi:hypothetical protein
MLRRWPCHPRPGLIAAPLHLSPPAAQVLKVDSARKAIVIKGTVPGKAGSIVEIMPAKIVGKNC